MGGNKGRGTKTVIFPGTQEGVGQNQSFFQGQCVVFG